MKKPEEKWTGFSIGSWNRWPDWFLGLGWPVNCGLKPEAQAFELLGRPDSLSKGASAPLV